MAKITSYAELEKQINKACSKAVQNTCNKLLEVLQQYIMSEYYDVFNPKKYHRTMQFYRSAMTEMLSETCGIIFMNPDVMYYPIQKLDGHGMGLYRYMKQMKVLMEDGQRKNLLSISTFMSLKSIVLKMQLKC